MTLWETEEAAGSGVVSGFYDEQVAKVVMLLREPPGRDHYQVLFSDSPALAAVPHSAFRIVCRGAGR